MKHLEQRAYLAHLAAQLEEHGETEAAEYVRDFEAMSETESFTPELSCAKKVLRSALYNLMLFRSHPAGADFWESVLSRLGDAPQALFVRSEPNKGRLK